MTPGNGIKKNENQDEEIGRGKQFPANAQTLDIRALATE